MAALERPTLEMLDAELRGEDVELRHAAVICLLDLLGTLRLVVMENLLEAIVAHRAATAILDITGVPTVDPPSAQHLIKTVAAARLMGAECVISGIRPAIAQAIVHLGIDLGGITTRTTPADAPALALGRAGTSSVAVAGTPGPWLPAPPPRARPGSRSRPCAACSW
ncbi:STAS domain-containing protein [Embleya scabrispora]|uniref:STAS domain-containing protein n=1 Tax=Embleya scabrispora TaxID=159449 RepID=UPI0026B4D9AA